MTIAPRIRFVGYVVGYLLAGVWAALAPYLAHRGVDAYTLALVAALVALVGGGLHAVAAGHIALPTDAGAVDDGYLATDPPLADAPAPVAPVVAAPVESLAPGTPISITPQTGV